MPSWTRAAADELPDFMCLGRLSCRDRHWADELKKTFCSVSAQTCFINFGRQLTVLKTEMKSRHRIGWKIRNGFYLLLDNSPLEFFFFITLLSGDYMSVYYVTACSIQLYRWRPVLLFTLLLSYSFFFPEGLSSFRLYTVFTMSGGLLLSAMVGVRLAHKKCFSGESTKSFESAKEGKKVWIDFCFYRTVRNKKKNA